jgi:hypothetical protein
MKNKLFNLAADLARVQFHPVHDDEVCAPCMKGFLPPPVAIEHIVEVAADRAAMLDALAEFGFRMVIERGGGWEQPYRLVIDEATAKIHDKLRDEIKSKDGK